MKKNTKEPRLETTTIVLPFEYDVQRFINSLISISNADNDYLVPSDVGKVVGIYHSASMLYSVLLDVLTTVHIENPILRDEVCDALDTFIRVDDNI